MATTYKKLSDSIVPAGTKEEDKWKYQIDQKSVTQSPVKSRHTYAYVKEQLDEAEAKVAELTAELSVIESKAKE